MDEENGKEGRRNLSHRFERVLPGVGARAVRLEARPRPHGDEHGFVREIHGEAGVFARLRGELLKADVGVEHGEKRRLFIVRVENDLGDGVARCRAVENPSDEFGFDVAERLFKEGHDGERRVSLFPQGAAVLIGIERRVPAPQFRGDPVVGRAFAAFERDALEGVAPTDAVAGDEAGGKDRSAVGRAVGHAFLKKMKNALILQGRGAKWSFTERLKTDEAKSGAGGNRKFRSAGLLSRRASGGSI